MAFPSPVVSLLGPYDGRIVLWLVIFQYLADTISEPCPICFPAFPFRHRMGTPQQAQCFSQAKLHWYGDRSGLHLVRWHPWIQVVHFGSFRSVQFLCSWFVSPSLGQQ